MAFEDILHIVGGANLYQFKILITFMAANMIPGIASVIPVFIAATRKYYCSSPFEDRNTSQQCQVDSQNGTIVKCSEWTFDPTPMSSTIQSQFTLTCSSEFLANLTSTFFFLGFMVGCTLYGKVSDSFGRKPALIASCVNVWSASVVSAFVPNYWSFSLFRFIAGMGVGGIQSIMFTIATEVPNSAVRVHWSIHVHQGWSVGIALMSPIAYVVRSHFVLQLILYGSMIVALPFFFLFITESPRWLFVKRKTQDLQVLVTNIAQQNGKTLPPNFNVEDYYDETSEPKERRLTDLCRFRSLRKVTLIVWMDWFICSISFFAASLGVGDLAGSIFVNSAISAALEIPSRFLAVFLVQKIGRIPSIVVPLAIGGICNLINAFLIGKSDLAIVMTISAMIVKVGLTVGFDVVWMYSAEVFPTEIRNLGVGTSSTWGRVGGTLSALVALLGKVWPMAPNVLLGVLPLIAAFASCFLPETKMVDLPETLEEGEALARSAGFFGRNRATKHRNREETHGQELLMDETVTNKEIPTVVT